MNKIQDFVMLVRNMRTEQNRYFRTRSQEALQKAKHFERLVDDVLYNITTTPLFSDCEPVSD